jgi:hypothetical protein
LQFLDLFLRDGVSENSGWSYLPNYLGAILFFILPGHFYGVCRWSQREIESRQLPTLSAPRYFTSLAPGVLVKGMAIAGTTAPRLKACIAIFYTVLLRHLLWALILFAALKMLRLL